MLKNGTGRNRTSDLALIRRMLLPLSYDPIKRPHCMRTCLKGATIRLCTQQGIGPCSTASACSLLESSLKLRNPGYALSTMLQFSFQLLKSPITFEWRRIGFVQCYLSLTGYGATLGLSERPTHTPVSSPDEDLLTGLDLNQRPPIIVLGLHRLLWPSELPVNVWVRDAGIRTQGPLSGPSPREIALNRSATSLIKMHLGESNPSLTLPRRPGFQVLQVLPRRGCTTSWPAVGI